MNYATVNDIEALWRPLSEDESARAEKLIPLVSSTLNLEAERLGQDLAARVLSNPDYAEVAKGVTVDVVARVLMTSTNQEPLSQFSQSALGYSVSGTYLVPGGGLYIKKAELQRLGLLRPKYGGFEPYVYPRYHHRIDKSCK